MIDPYDYYCWGSFQQSDLEKLSLEDLQILLNFEDVSGLSSERARQAFRTRQLKIRANFNTKKKELDRRRSSSPAVELKNLEQKIALEQQELALIRQKKSKIERIESDLERKIQRQIERIQYLSNL